MKVGLIVSAVIVALVFAAPAEALYLPSGFARNVAKRTTREDCEYHPRCTTWKVFSCSRRSPLVIACESAERYGNPPSNRDCYFPTIVEANHRGEVFTRFGYTRCYNASGEEIR